MSKKQNKLAALLAEFRSHQALADRLAGAALDREERLACLVSGRVWKRAANLLQAELIKLDPKLDPKPRFGSWKQKITDTLPQDSSTSSELAALASYNPKACCGDNCFALGYNPVEPCWGDVSVTEEEVSTNEAWWIHECKGHANCYNGGKYKPELTEETAK